MTAQLAIVPTREVDVASMLRHRYSQTVGNGPRYVCAEQVRNAAGFDAQRTCDFIAVDTWPSQGLAVHGHEIKVSRSDWLHELKHPEKAAAFIPHMTYWWLVIPDRSIARVEELPEGWGLLAPRGNRLVIARRAQKRPQASMPWTMTVAMLRALDRGRR